MVFLFFPSFEHFVFLFIWISSKRYSPAQMDEVLSDLFGASHRRRARARVAAVIPVSFVVKYEGRQFVLVLTTTLHVLRVHGAQASRVLFVFCNVHRNKQDGYHWSRPSTVRNTSVKR